MFTCHCGKEFKTQRAVNAHQIAHKEGVRYKVRTRKNPEFYDCLQCGTQSKWGTSKTNKFCDNKCQQDFAWNIVKQEIEQGLRGATKRYIVERFGDICVSCGLTNEWNGKPITLQLDHKDGNSDNNSIENLRILCPNCHTQTDTYGSKGQGNRYKKVTKRNKWLQEYKNARLT